MTAQQASQAWYSRVRAKIGAGELWALWSALAYGATNIFVRIGIAHTDPTVGVWLRVAPVTLVTLAVVLFTARRAQLAPRGKRFIGWRDIGLLLAGGTLLYLIGNPLYFQAMALANVIVVTPLIGTQMVWAGLIAALFLGERPSWAVFGGMAVTIAGITVLSLGQGKGGSLGASWAWAIPLGLGAAASWSASSVIAAGVMRRGADRFTNLAVSSLWGSLALGVFLLLSGRGAGSVGSQQEVMSLLFAGVLNLVAQVTLATALTLTSVASASVISTLQVGLGPLLAAIFLREPLGWQSGAGILLIMGGVMVAQVARARATARTAQPATNQDGRTNDGDRGRDVARSVAEQSGHAAQDVHR